MDALAVALLEGLNSVGAKIIYVAMQTRVQREIFRYSFRKKILYGTGFSWFTAWVSEGILSETDNSPCSDCLRGAEGLIGLVEGAASKSPGQTLLEPLWNKHSSRANCAVENGDWHTSYKYDPDAENVFCDSDGDPETLGGYVRLHAR